MASDVFGRIGRVIRNLILFVCVLLMPLSAAAAPYAAMVIDARNGEVLHSRNADTQLHPASLTKMMTLYVVFEAIEHGEISLDTMVTISQKAASEPPSKIGFRAGQQVALRYLIRAAAVKSANDAATALGEAIEGSEAAFARRMNRTAEALGMSRTHFKNAHGLTESGHLSTARDMTTLGRHLFYDYPAYYNLFSRTSANVNGTTVLSSNRRFLSAYEGADGIKTGFTNAAGFNLVSSAHRGSEHIIATVFGGTSSAARNARVMELLDMGFERAPTRVAVRAPGKPPYMGRGSDTMIASGDEVGGAGKTIRISVAPMTSIRPSPRPTVAPVLTAEIAAEVNQTVDAVVAGLAEAAASQEVEAEAAVVAEATEAEAEEATVLAAVAPPPERPMSEEAVAQVAESEADNARLIAASVQAPAETPLPPARPAEMILTAVERPVEDEAQEVVARVSTSGGRHYGVNVGLYGSQYEAERVLLKTALGELATLGEALRKVGKNRQGFQANFVGMTKENAELACRRLTARGSHCSVIEAGSQG